MRAHLRAGHDVVVSQFAVEPDFFDVIDAIVDETAAAYRQIVLTADPHVVAARFRRRRAQRAGAGEDDPSTNIPEDRIDEVVARATTELVALAAARPRTMVVSTDGDVDETYLRVRDALRRRRA